jgi:DNA-binding transcriptional ArsR family regulator
MVDLDLEGFAERNERLGRENPRQTAIESVLGSLESTGPAVAPGAFEGLTMVVSDAILDQDDYALRLMVDAGHRLAMIWRRAAHDGDEREALGQLTGLHNLASMALERIVPTAMLAELEPDTVPYRLLVLVADEQGCSNDQISIALGVDKTAVSRAGRRLAAAGLATKRRAGRRNAWEITPRGLSALGSIQSGGRMRPRRRQRV